MSSREPQQRGRKERFIVIPFSSTCRSAASVDVVQASKPQPQGGGGGVTSAPAVVVGKPAKAESLSLVARLLRGFKNLSHQIFAVHDEEDEEEEEQEMVIGLPTDVKHVAHIGWDGSTSTTTSLRSWNRAGPPPPDAASTSSSSSAAAPQAQEPTLSARQLELAMAAQASAAGTGASAAAASTSGSGATSSSSSSSARRHRHYS